MLDERCAPPHLALNTLLRWILPPLSVNPYWRASLQPAPAYPVWDGLTVNLEVADLATLAGQQAQEDLPSLVFYTGTGDLNPGS